MTTQTVTIAGTDHSSRVRLNTLQVEDAVEERSVAFFELEDAAAAYTFTRGQSVVISDSVVGTLFTGMVEYAEVIPYHDTRRLHRIACVDYHALAEWRTITKGWASETLQNIVLGVVTEVLYEDGVTATTSTIGGAAITVTEAPFDSVRCSDALDRLAELSGYTWYIDGSKVLYFQERTTSAAPWTVGEADVIRGSVYYDTKAPMYRNRQIIRGARSKTSTQTESFVGDGTCRQWTLAYAVAEVPSSVTVGGAAKTIGIRGVESGKNFYWSKDDHVISQEAGDTVLASTDTLQVQYKGFYPVKIIRDDSAEIVSRRTATGTSGIIECVDDGYDLSTDTGAIERADAKLTTYAQITAKARFITTRSGLVAGQYATITLTNPSISLTGLVSRVDVSANMGILYYNVTVLTGPNMGCDEKLYYRLGGPVTKITYDDTSVAAVTTTASESVTLGESVTEAELSTVPDTTTYPAATLYPC